ncbi:prolyl 4-hydroxylase [Haematococcus lacustris]
MLPGLARFQSVVTSGVCEQLIRKGFAVIDDVLPPSSTSKLREEIVALAQGGVMHTNSTHLVRGTETQLLEKSHILEAELSMDTGIQALAPLCHQVSQDTSLATMLSLFMPMLSLDQQATKLQYNRGQGGCFPMHLDTDAMLDGRKVTAIFYLNPEWQPAQGGLLKLYPWPAPPVSIAPLAGRMVLFSSPHMVHRVTPSLPLTHPGPGPAQSPPQPSAPSSARCCFTVWLSQFKGRGRGRSQGRGLPPSLAALQPPLGAQGDIKATVAFLMSPFIRHHATKLAYAEEWEQSLRESHPASPMLEAMLAQHNSEVQHISKALQRYLPVIDRLKSEPELVELALRQTSWF